MCALFETLENFFTSTDHYTYCVLYYHQISFISTSCSKLTYVVNIMIFHAKLVHAILVGYASRQQPHCSIGTATILFGMNILYTAPLQCMQNSTLLSYKSAHTLCGSHALSHAYSPYTLCVYVVGDFQHVINASMHYGHFTHLLGFRQLNI